MTTAPRPRRTSNPQTARTRATRSIAPVPDTNPNPESGEALTMASMIDQLRTAGYTVEMPQSAPIPDLRYVETEALLGALEGKPIPTVGKVDPAIVREELRLRLAPSQELDPQPQEPSVLDRLREASDTYDDRYLLIILEEELAGAGYEDLKVFETEDIQEAVSRLRRSIPASRASRTAAVEDRKATPAAPRRVALNVLSWLVVGPLIALTLIGPFGSASNHVANHTGHTWLTVGLFIAITILASKISSKLIILARAWYTSQMHRYDSYEGR